MAEHIDLGQLGEELAVKFLEAKGYTIFERNYNFRDGEIDIVAFIPNVIHFVEVKTRSNSALNSPEISVSPDKRSKIAKTAECFLFERQMMTVPAVFDIIAIGMDDIYNPVFRHYEEAFVPPGNKWF